MGLGSVGSPRSGGQSFLLSQADVLRACLHGGGGPQVGEVPLVPPPPPLVGLPISPYNLSFLLDFFHMRGGVPHLGGLPAQPCRVARLGGVRSPFSPCEC